MHIEEYTYLQDYFLKLQEADPKGVYYLKTVPLNYQDPKWKTTGTPVGASSFLQKLPADGIMFHSYVVIPSATIHYYMHSRRICSMDGCHLISRFDGVGLGAHVKDATNAIGGSAVG